MGAEVELVFDARAELGEGPSWDPATGRLIWVDITADVVHRFDAVSGDDERFEVGQPVGAAVPTSDGRLALAVSDGFAFLDPASGMIERIADVEADLEGTMMNDGKCDAAGRLWAGTKDAVDSRPIGALYRLGSDRRPVQMLTGLTVSNGLGWSPDRATMYFIDSPTQRIDVFDFDLDGGEIANRRTLTEIPKAWGLPDGMTVDEEGFLWVAFWGGSAVRRFDPAGEVVATAEFPMSQVTSCAFGGEDLSDLYVTSARDGLTESQLADQPLAGGLFRLRPGVRGQPPNPFAVAPEHAGSPPRGPNTPMTDEQIIAATVGERPIHGGPVDLAEYDPTWPEVFARHRERIVAALGEGALQIEHIGSTSVPGLAAKPTIDILLVVASSANEDTYLPAMEAAGYELRIREPAWHEHRMFADRERTAQVHVLSEGDAEIERCLLFRDRLRTDRADRELYERTKRELANKEWKYVQNYADAKGPVVEEIIARAREVR